MAYFDNEYIYPPTRPHIIRDSKMLVLINELFKLLFVLKI